MNTPIHDTLKADENVKLDGFGYPQYTASTIPASGAPGESIVVDGVTHHWDPLNGLFVPAVGRGGRIDLTAELGVSGDGVVDCTAALQAKLAANPRGDFWIGGTGDNVTSPAAFAQNYQYRITDTISFGAEQSLEMHPNSEFVYEGPDDRPAIEFRDHASLETQGIKVRRPTIAWDTTDTGSIGIYVVNCNYSEFGISSVLNFETGILLEGDTDTAPGPVGGCAYNTINLYEIRGNKRGIRFAVNGFDGHANSNNFIGGRIRLDSTPNAGTNGPALIPIPGTRYIDLGTVGNGNNFFGTILEGGMCEKTIEVISTFNTFYGCRLEQTASNDGGMIHFLPGSYGNGLYLGNHNWGVNSHRPDPLPDDTIRIVDDGWNTVIGSRGIRAYTAGLFGRGDVGAFTAKAGQPNHTDAYAVAGLDTVDVMTAAIKIGSTLSPLTNAAELHLMGADGVVHVIAIDAAGVLEMDGNPVDTGGGGNLIGTAPTGYVTPTNFTTDRTMGDVSVITPADTANVLSTLIEDLKARGVIAT